MVLTSVLVVGRTVTDQQTRVVVEVEGGRWGRQVKEEDGAER